MSFYLTAKHQKMLCISESWRYSHKLQEGRYTKFKKVICGYESQNFWQDEYFYFLKIYFYGCVEQTDRRKIN